MTDIGSAVGTAGRTLAAFFNRAVIQLIFLIKQIQFAVVGIYMSMAAISGWVNTVKKVYSPVYCL